MTSLDARLEKAQANRTTSTDDFTRGSRWEAARRAPLDKALVEAVRALVQIASANEYSLDGMTPVLYSRNALAQIESAVAEMEGKDGG